MEKKKSAEAMRRQIFEIQKYNPVNWKLKWNFNTTWEINTIENYIKLLSLNFLKQYKQHSKHTVTQIWKLKHCLHIMKSFIISNLVTEIIVFLKKSYKINKRGV